jgi:hypothetical protein
MTLLLCFALSSGAFAGEVVDQAARHAILVDRRDSWNVVPLGKEGLLLIGADRSASAFTFSRYDTDFRPTWTRDFEAPDRAALVDTWVDGGAAWLLLHRGRQTDFGLVRVDLATGEPTWQAVDPGVKAHSFDALLVRGKDLYVAAIESGWDILRGGRGSLVHVDLPSKRAEMVDLMGAVGSDRAWLSRLVSTPDGVGVTVAVDEKRHRTLYVVGLDGAKTKPPLVVAPGDLDDTNLLTGVAIPTGGERSLVVGTWANSARGWGSQGMYLAGFEGTTRSWLAYHSFTEFQHFFDYLPDKLRERIARRVERKQAQSDDVDLGYLLDLHAPMVLGDRVVLVAEAYYPEYHTYTTTQTTTVNGVTTTTTTTHQVFDGWRYTHAAVAAFDLQGALLWDASLPIGNVLSPTVREQVAVSLAGDHIEMMYCVAGKVYVATADGNAMHGEKVSQRLEAEEDETIKTSWDSHAAWWYDDWFLLWGFERVEGEGGMHTEFTFAKVRPGGG